MTYEMAASASSARSEKCSIPSQMTTIDYRLSRIGTIMHLALWSVWASKESGDEEATWRNPSREGIRC
jgi:hypothetical protein